MGNRDVACSLERCTECRPTQLKTSTEETPSCLLTQGMLVGTGLMGIQMTSTAQTEEVCPGADGASSRLTASVFQSVPLEVCQSNAVDPGRM